MVQEGEMLGWCWRTEPSRSGSAASPANDRNVTGAGYDIGLAIFEIHANQIGNTSGAARTFDRDLTCIRLSRSR